MSQIDLLTRRQLERWYKLKDHPVQLDLMRAVDDGIRFPVVPAGRRSGKTERGKRFLAKRSMYMGGEKFFAGAPTRDQAKKIWWNDLKDLCLTSMHMKKPSESDLIIFMPNGTELHVLGFDEPARFEGIPWTGGIIDEIANVKEKAVEENILPGLNTINPLRPEYRAWCWFIGVPEGLGHYKRMADRGMPIEGKYPNPNWRTFHWKSAEILPPDVIEDAKKTMSLKQFKQEYEASFETAGGRIYEEFNSENFTSATQFPHEALHWMHDQNFTPLSSAICVMRDDIPYFVGEIVLESAVSRQSAKEFCERYKNHQNKIVYIYGDPSGRSGEKHGHKSDYDDIEEVLTMNGWRYERRVASKAPAIKDRQNAVRARIQTADSVRHMYVNPEKCPWLKEGLETVQFKEGSTFQEDDKNKFQHITTALGYFTHWHWPAGQMQTESGTTTGHW